MTGEFQGVLVINTNTTIADGATDGKKTISQITICETNGTPCKYRFAVIPDGSALAAKHYRIKDEDLWENESVELLDEPIELNGKMKLILYVNASNVTYQIDTDA